MRTGFREVTRAELAAGIAENRAQDPRTTTSLQLKHISKVPFVVPLEAEPAPRSLGAAATPTRRRRSSSS